MAQVHPLQWTLNNPNVLKPATVFSWCLFCHLPPISAPDIIYQSVSPQEISEASGRVYDTRCYNRPLGLTTPAHRLCTCHHLYAAPAHLSSHLPSPLGLSQLPVNTCFQIIAFALVIKTKQTPVLSLETSPPNKQSANDIHGYQVQGCPV